MADENLGLDLASQSGQEDIASALRSLTSLLSRLPDLLTLGSKNITENGTYIAKDDDLDAYTTVIVTVPNTYHTEDEGKVVSEGTLVSQESQTITKNGTYDTTLIHELTANISGEKNYPVVAGIFDESISADIVISAPYTQIIPASTTIETALTDYFTRKLADLNGTVVDGNKSVILTEELAELSVSAFESEKIFSSVGAEYYGYIYGSTIETALNLVLLGDFSQGGSNSGNILSDSINNYSGIILQGIYKKTRDSAYNTSCLYQDIELNTAYWAGMKDRNASYQCNATFTDDETVSLSGNLQVIIYGIL